MMGPDCGTALVSGVGFGFANRVTRGPVGLVGASGTGLQEVCCRLAECGIGISHAIGTGSQDLSREVDGAMSEMGLRLLAADPDTKVIGLIAKHPAPEVAGRLHGSLAALCAKGKPVVVRYLGQPAPESRDRVCYAGSLDQAATELAARLPGGERREGDPVCLVRGDLKALAPVVPAGRLVGLFGGGSLLAEAQWIFTRHGLQADTPQDPIKASPPLPGTGHLLIDTGDEGYTRGRPHPMVDASVRCALIRAAGADERVGVILFDVVLGDGAHLDPAPELAAAVAAARAAREGRPLQVVASVSGTPLDPQDPARQRRLLAAAGIHVQPSAARAAAVAAVLAGGRPG
jgi:hypothetical protein